MEKDVKSQVEPSKGSIPHTTSGFPCRLAPNSYNPIDAITEYTGEVMTGSTNVLIRSFKFLLMHEEGIRKALNEYQSMCAGQGNHVLLPGQEFAKAIKRSDSTGIVRAAQDEKEINISTVNSDPSKTPAEEVTKHPSTESPPPTREPATVEPSTEKNTKAQTDGDEKVGAKEEQRSVKKQRKARDELRLW